MPPGSDTVDAAPNLCQVKIKLESVKQSEQYPEKFELSFALLESNCLDGPDFISRHVGKQLNGITFNPPPELAVGVLMNAQASYIGGPRTGVFHLSELELTK